MTVSVATLFGLVTSAVFVSTGFAQNCLSRNEEGPALPMFPDQFSTEIEANIVHSNLTLSVTDYYDNINNRGRIDTYSPFGTNTTLVNYNTLEVSHIMTSADGSTSCFAAPLASNSSRFARRLFGAQFDNGTAHIVTTSQFLLFGAEFNETYIGMEMVRGIPCHRWQSCNTSADGRTSYTIDYFFTQSNWSNYPNMIPVQVIVNGTRPDNDTADSPIHQVLNVYSFINFRPGPADDDLFRVPPGQPCKGRITGKSLPPLPQDYYSALYESIDQQTSVISYFKVYYIYSQQLYRIDISTGFRNETVLIEDFNEGVQYFINSRYGSCSISPINPANSSAVAVYPNGTLHLEGLKRHFLRQNDSAYSYEGVSQLRGVDTESWITFLDREVFNNQTVLTDGYVQVYYTRPNWSVATSYNSYFNMSVPWVYVVVGNYTYPSDNGTWVTYSDTNVFNVLEFQTVEPNYDVFDVSICFGVDQHSFLSLTLPLPAGVRFTSIDHTLLKSKVRMALSQAVNIPASRIGGIYIFQITNDNIIVGMRVLDAPPYSIHKNSMSRDEIVSQLISKVNSGQVTITLGEVTFQPSLRLQNDSCNPSKGEDDDDGLAVGAVAGLSIALFIVGLLIGIGLSFLLQWLFKYSKGKYVTSSYNKHQDEPVKES